MRLLNEDSFLSAGQDGGLHYWKTSQKRPVMSCHAVHGYDACNPRWISSMATVKFSNLAATGSYDGVIRLWDIEPDLKVIRPLLRVSLDGFVNDIALSPSLMVAGLGSEHRLGRWWSLKGNRNKIAIVKLP